MRRSLVVVVAGVLLMLGVQGSLAEPRTELAILPIERASASGSGQDDETDQKASLDERNQQPSRLPGSEPTR